jgi:hypothetical protein
LLPFCRNTVPPSCSGQDTEERKNNKKGKKVKWEKNKNKKREENKNRRRRRRRRRRCRSFHEDGGSMDLRNVCILPQHRRLRLEYY